MPRFSIRTCAAPLVVALLAGCSRSPPPPALQVAQLFPVPRAVPAFTLARSDGTPLTRADWRGRYTLVFMGYTHCPDICPITLLTLRTMWNALDKAGVSKRVGVDFVSVDPRRDTLPLLGEYVHGFDATFVGATGSEAELKKLSAALLLPYRIVPGAHGGYGVDHSATVAIIGPDAREIGVFMPPLYAAPMAADLERLLAWKSR